MMGFILAPGFHVEMSVLRDSLAFLKGLRKRSDRQSLPQLHENHLCSAMPFVEWDLRVLKHLDHLLVKLFA